MRASALEKLKLERKVCQEDNLTYSTSPKKKVELDAKIEENKIEEEEISQDELKSFLEPDLKGKIPFFMCVNRSPPRHMIRLG